MKGRRHTMMLRKGWLRHLDFIALDVACIEIALLIAKLVTTLVMKELAFEYWQLFILFPLIYVVMSILMDAYNGILQRGYLKELGALLKIDIVTSCFLIFVFYFLLMLPTLPRLVPIVFFLIHIPLAYAARFNHKFYLRKRYSKVKYARQIVVATTEKAAREMIQTIKVSAIRNYQFFGLAVLDKAMVGEKIEDVPVTADKNSFIRYIKEQIVDEVFINLPDDSAATLELTDQLLQMGITVHIFMEGAYQKLPNRVISNIFGYNVLSTTISPVTFRQSLMKRVIDICGGFAGCLITALLTIIIGPIIYIKSPGPIFFSQIRVGKKGREFKIYKFRSMYMDAEERKKELMAQNTIKDGMMFKMDNDPRIIKGIGNFIRKTSLDEFPQFWNVLKGDMSIVGTRPPTLDEYHRYSPHHKRRLCMLPGITGLWQTSGRSSILDFERVVELDTEYIERWSLNLDFKIIVKTVMQVFKIGDDAK